MLSKRVVLLLKYGVLCRCGLRIPLLERYAQNTEEQVSWPLIVCLGRKAILL